MIDKIKTSYLLITASGISLVVVGTGLYFMSSLYSLNDDYQVNDDKAVLADQKVESSADFNSAAGRVSVAADLSYQQALEQYRNYRIQLQDCIATPHQVTYKTGTKVMLDNRSVEPTQVWLDGQPIRLWGYEFKIVTLTSKSFPHTIDVDCEWLDQPAYNIARVLIQQ